MTKKQEENLELITGSLFWILLILTVSISFSYGLYSSLKSFIIVGIVNIIISITIPFLIWVYVEIKSGRDKMINFNKIEKEFKK